MKRYIFVDDDVVTREVAVLLAAQAGFDAAAVSSGEEIVLLLTGLADGSCPKAIVTDMQMPGLCGSTLAHALRSHCSASTLLIAMSASLATLEELDGFDGFLRKPFSATELEHALEARPVLSEATYTSLAHGMPRAQLMELYAMCLDDADRRIGLMRTLAISGDCEAYERAAHAIKGGCGMVGALELAALAEAMEQNGPPGDGSAVPLDEFLLASGRLRRILAAQGP